MSPLLTLGVFLILFVLVMVVSQWRDVPRRTRLDVDPDWRVDTQRDRRETTESISRKERRLPAVGST